MKLKQTEFTQPNSSFNFMKTIAISFFLSLILLTSCNNSNCENTQKEVKEIMKTWYKKKINFPENMQVLVDTTVIKEKIPNHPRLGQYTIVHFFTADCDKCVNELNMIKKSLKEPFKSIPYT